MEHGVKRLVLSEEAKKEKLARDKVKIQGYRDLTVHILKLKEKQEYTLKSLEMTSKVLNTNPEFYTVWNFRRDILVHLFEVGTLDLQPTLSEDLSLVMAFMKKFPKCYWIWNHRKWCLARLQDAKVANWQYELAIVSKLLDMDSRNFHGWQYRRYIIENMEAELDNEAREGNVEHSKNAVLKANIQEFEFTTLKINKNISNYSAWHNRSKLIPKLYKMLQECGSRSEYGVISDIFVSPYSILIHELELIKTGIYMDVDDTSVWQYLYWLLGDEFFVRDLSSHSEKKEKTYLDILTNMLQIVEELNDLEKSDNEDNMSHCWCLKTILFLKTLIIKQTQSDAETSVRPTLAEECKEHLVDLLKIDPLRKGRYYDQLDGAPIIF